MKRFAVIRVGKLGDTVWAITFLDALETIYGKDIQVDWIGKSFCLDLFKHDPRIHKVHVLNHRRLALRWSRAKRRIAAYARRHPYDMVINAETGSMLSDLVNAIPAKYKIGPPERMPSPSDVHDIEAHNYLLQQLPIDVRPDFKTQHFNPKLYPAPRIPAELKLPERYIVVTPATSSSARGRSDNRIWPIASWDKLIKILSQQCPIVILGLKRDLPFIHQLGELPSSVVNLVGETSLDVSLKIIQDARLLVASDTGTTHVAAALEVPIAAIYGAPNPRMTGPYVKGKTTKDCKAMVFSCYIDNGFGPYLPDTPPNQSMETITPEMLAGPILELLKENKD